MRFEQTRMGFQLGALVLSAALALGACGDDDGGGKKDAGVDAGPVEPTPELCIQQAKDLDSQSPQETIECLCNKCLQQMVDCNADEGCVEIRACSDRTGCRGTACYFGTPECMAIIDMYGVQGISTTLATQLNDCNDAMCGGGSNKDAATGGDSAVDSSTGDDAGEDAGH